MKTTISITDCHGKTLELKPKFFRYEVKDFMGSKRSALGIQLYATTEYGEEPFAIITKSFGEFIGMKDCAYIDLNNFPFASKFLELGVAQDTGLYKASGFCHYPLWHFNEDFLHEIDDVTCY